MIEKTCVTFDYEICIAGDIDVMRDVLRKECFDEGLCVTLTPTEFIYSGGMETGAIIRLINYPRFPTNDESLFLRATSIAIVLMNRLSQKTCTIRGTKDSIYMRNDNWKIQE